MALQSGFALDQTPPISADAIVLYMYTAYHYMYQAAIRLQLACGNQRNSLTDYKANLLVAGVEFLLAISAVIWASVLFRITPLLERPKMEFIYAGVLAFLTDRSLRSSREVRDRYGERFSTLPDSKRRIFDVLVALVAVGSFPLMIFSGIKSHEHAMLVR